MRSCTHCSMEASLVALTVLFRVAQGTARTLEPVGFRIGDSKKIRMCLVFFFLLLQFKGRV